MSTETQSALASRETYVLQAARRVFLSYGFQRASMVDVARAAELSRAGLYKYFASKDELFRAVVVDLHESLLQKAEAEATQATERGVEATLVALFEAYVGEFVRAYGNLPHSEDLYEAGGRLCSDVLESSRERFLRCVASVLRQAAKRGEIAAGSPSRSARLLHSAILGIKHLPASSGGFSKDLADLVALFVGGLKKS